MRDLDFDELDKAVKAVMSEGDSAPSPTPSPTPNLPSTDVPVTNAPSASTVRKGSLVGGSKESFKPKKRTRLFMDVKNGSGPGVVKTDPLVAGEDTRLSSDPKGRSSSGSFRSPVVSPIDEAKVESEDKTDVESVAASSEPFQDAFASLEKEVKSFGLEGDSGKVGVDIDQPKSTPTPVKSEEDEGYEEADASFSPFLSSVDIDKRPLGGYANGADDVVDGVDTESITTSDSTKPKVVADDFYGADPLADMTIEDIDAAIVAPDGVSSTPDPASAGKQSGDDSEKKAGKVSGLDELSSRIERELSGESTDDESVEGGAQIVKPGEESHADSSGGDSGKDNFHEESPIHQEDEVLADLDAKFSDEEIVGAGSAADQGSHLPASKVDVVSAPIEETPAPSKGEDVEVASDEEVGEEETPADEGIGSMTVSPGDDTVSVEQVAAMEESIAGQTEEPEKKPVKKGVLGRVKRSPETKASKAHSKERSSILSEGGPTSIQPQYRTSSESTKVDKGDHGVFNPESFSMPVGTSSKAKKGVSPLVMIIITVVSIALGVGGAFALFYSGLV